MGAANWLYFLFVGWWLASLWVAVAIPISIVAWPVGLGMMYAAPKVAFGPGG